MLMLMQKFHNILLAILAIALFGHSLAQGQPLMEKRSAVISPAEEESDEPTYPFAQQNLFYVYHPVESGVSISNTLAPLLSAEEQEKSAVHKFIASVVENRATVYLHIYHLVDRAPILLKYIFPFHTFL